MDTLALVEQASRGDPVALEELLLQNLGRLRAFIRARSGAVLRGRESCSDLVQTVCREALQDLPGFRYESEAKFRHWLFERAEHKLIDRARYWQAAARDHQRELADAGDDEAQRDLATWLTPSREAMSKERLWQIQVALDQLPEDYRTAILLHRLVELPYPDMAQAMQRSEGAVRNLVYRGLARLSALLHAEDAPPAPG